MRKSEQVKEELRPGRVPSDKIVLETSRSVLFKALLVSESAIGDILASPGDGEVLLAGCVTSTREESTQCFPW